MDAPLILSTAKPAEGGDKPVLGILNAIFKPPPPPAVSMNAFPMRRKQ